MNRSARLSRSALYLTHVSPHRRCLLAMYIVCCLISCLLMGERHTGALDTGALWRFEGLCEVLDRRASVRRKLWEPPSGRLVGALRLDDGGCSGVSQGDVLRLRRRGRARRRPGSLPRAALAGGDQHERLHLVVLESFSLPRPSRRLRRLRAMTEPLKGACAPALECVPWAVSRKKRNQLAHALVGNTEGETLKIGFVNVNGVLGKHRPRALLALRADIIGLQETHLDRGAAAACKGRFHPMAEEWGAPTPGRAGVGFLHRPGASWHTMPLTWPEASPCHRAWAAGRLHAMILALGRGQRQIVVYTVYGWAQSRTIAAERERTHEIVSAVMGDAAARGLPAILGGDLNLEVAESAVLRRMAPAGWSEVARMFGRQGEVTCTKGSGSHIDHIYVNSLMVNHVVSLDTASRVGLADHVPQVVTIDICVRSQLTQRARFYEPVFPHGAEPPLCDRLLDMPSSFEDALLDGDVDTAYRVWSRHAEQCLMGLAARAGKSDQVKTGRGTVRIDPEHEWPRAKRAQATTIHEQRLWKTVCRLSEIILRPHGWSAQRLWQKVHNDAELLLGDAEAHAEAKRLLDAGPLGLACAEQLRELFSAHCELLAGKARRKRIAEWKLRMQSSVKAQHAWMRHDGQSVGTFCLKGADGTRSANLERQFDIIREAWQAITEAHKDGEPSADDFFDKYGQHVERVECELSGIETQDLIRAIMEMPPTSSGLDGWSQADLRALACAQPHVIEHLCQFLNTVERVGRWPKALYQAYTALIPKSEQPPDLATDLRPITVLGTVYRVWGRLRVGQLSGWQESWAHDELWGGRRGRGAEPLLLATALDIEEHGNNMGGISFDLSKAFDRVPRELLIQLLHRMGMPACVLRPYSAILRSSTRRYKLGGCLDVQQQLHGGIFQGCPLSMMSLNAFANVWVRSLAATWPECAVRGYVDDVSGTACRLPEERLVHVLEGVVRDSLELVENMGGRLDMSHGKSFTFGSPRIAGRVHPQLAHKTEFRLVGGSFVCRARGRAPTDLEIKRLKAWLEQVRRARHLPIGWGDRAQAVLRTRSCMSWGAATHRMSDTKAFQTELTRVRSDVMRCLIRRDRYVASPGIYLTLLSTPLLNPFFARVVDSLLVVWRALQALPQLAGRLRACFAAGRVNADGPISRLRQIDAMAGFEGSVSELFGLRPEDHGQWLHNLRQRWRDAEWRRVSRDRPDFRGIELGIDREITLRRLRVLDVEAMAPPGGATPTNEEARRDAAVLRLLLTGGLFTRDVVSRHVAGQSTRCDCGVDEDQDVLHVSWRCRHYDVYRAPLRGLLRRLAQAQPCMRYATLLTPPDVDLAPQLEVVQNVLVRIWRQHIRRYLGGDAQDPGDDPGAPAQEAESVSADDLQGGGADPAVGPGAPAQGAEPISADDSQGGGAAPAGGAGRGAAVGEQTGAYMENGHVIVGAPGGGVFCRKCGVYVREVMHRRLKISYRKCEQAGLKEADWLDRPGYADNPRRLADLFKATDEWANGHDLAWDGSVARVPPHGRVRCLKCSREWKWKDRHNMKSSPPNGCAAQFVGGERKTTPRGWISRRLLREDRPAFLRGLAASQGESARAQATEARSVASVAPAPPGGGGQVRPVVDESQGASVHRFLTGVFDDMG
jgi:exonuclease III